MKLVTPQERLKQKSGVKAVVAGPPGIGKTSLLLGLDPKKTIFVDLEAGDLSVQTFKGLTLQPENWNECKTLAVLAGGPNNAIKSTSADNIKAYSPEMHEKVVNMFPDHHNALQECDTIFIDSITVASRLAFTHAKQDPANYTKTGAIDTRGAYGQMGREIMEWLIHLQHIRDKNVIFCCILEKYEDDLGREQFQLQMEGRKGPQELPGIVDQMIIYDFVPEQDKDGNVVQKRTFLCRSEAHPLAKSRSKLINKNGYEPNDLNALLNKLSNNNQGDK